jgi:hypothetical protein
MTTDQLVQLVALAMCLVLAWNGLRGQQRGGRATLKMALSWFCIIVALTLALRLAGAR